MNEGHQMSPVVTCLWVLVTTNLPELSGWIIHLVKLSQQSLRQGRDYRCFRNMDIEAPSFCSAPMAPRLVGGRAVITKEALSDGMFPWSMYFLF